MKVVKISETERRNLCAELDYRNRTAARLGASVIEVMRGVEDQMNSTDERDEAAVGAALLELMKLARAATHGIRESEGKQTQTARAAMRKAGVDPDAATYTIDHEDGRILVLRDGKYIPVQV